MDKPKKCANPVCTCIPTDKSKYCSAHCEGQAGRTELVCRCGHADCGGNVSGRKPAMAPMATLEESCALLAPEPAGLPGWSTSYSGLAVGQALGLP